VEFLVLERSLALLCTYEGLRATTHTYTNTQMHFNLEVDRADYVYMQWIQDCLITSKHKNLYDTAVTISP